MCCSKADRASRTRAPPDRDSRHEGRDQCRLPLPLERAARAAPASNRPWDSDPRLQARHPGGRRTPRAQAVEQGPRPGAVSRTLRGILRPHTRVIDLAIRDYLDGLAAVSARRDVPVTGVAGCERRLQPDSDPTARYGSDRPDLLAFGWRYNRRQSKKRATATAWTRRPAVYGLWPPSCPSSWLAVALWPRLRPIQVQPGQGPQRGSCLAADEDSYRGPVVASDPSRSPTCYRSSSAEHIWLVPRPASWMGLADLPASADILRSRVSAFDRRRFAGSGADCVHRALS